MLKIVQLWKLADQRRRKIKCEKCGEIGHDIIDCMDESDIRLEKEIKQAIDRKQKELNKINKRLQEIKKTRETKEPQDKDTNSVPGQKYRPPRKGTQTEKSSRIKMIKPLIENLNLLKT